MAVPYTGELFTFVEPDGSRIQLRGFGNQFQAVFETVDGFAVVADPETGFHRYATLAEDDSALVPTEAAVGTVDPETLGVPRHLRPSRTAMRARAQAAPLNDHRRRWEIRRDERRAALAATGAGALAAAPPQPTAVGDVTGLCLLVEFPDVPATITRQQVDDFCNLPGYSGFGNNGSVFDYFSDVSAGRLRYRNSVAAYFTAAHPRAYYTDPSIAYGTRAQELIREGLDHLVAAGYDFGQLSADSANYVYALNIFYAGPTVNAWSQGLWPHSWSLATPYQASPSRRFSDYQITDIGTQLTLRTFCHENGHMVCDFPDLYDYGSESAGVGHYCLMCFGGSNTNPVHVSGYLKNVAGWATSLRTLDNGMTVDLAAGNEFLIHRKNATEYFLLENRRQAGRDAVLPDAGLAIWHVDELGSNSNEQMTAAQHYEASLEQADNRFDLEHNANGGDVTDLYGAPTTVFDHTSAPNSRWWDGTPSDLDIVEVSAPAPVMSVRTKGAVSLVIPNFGAVAGGWRVDQHPRFTADLTGDGRADIIGFGYAGAYVALNNGSGGFGPVTLAVPNFGHTAGGWRVDQHPRMLADLTGDGRADIVGFGYAGAYVALNNGSGGFGPVTLAVSNFGHTAGGWRVDRHPRMLADLTGDGRADIVGFGDAGVYVALNNGSGGFGPVTLAVPNFGAVAGGWRVDRHPRMLADLTGDGRADIVGFGDAGVYVALNNGSGGFGPVTLAVPNFGAVAGGWRVDRHPRVLADLTGDGRADIVGFGDAGVYVALNNGSGGFGPVTLAVPNFGAVAGGWRVDQHPRFTADLTGDGRADIVGFGYAGAYVALNNGAGGFGPGTLAVANFGHTAGGWRVDRHPRMLAELTGDGHADIVGFGDAGVYVALNRGGGAF